MPIMIGGAGSEPSPTTGTGDWVRATSPTLVTPVLGVATGTSLALGGATIGSNALAVTGTANISGTITAGADVNVSGYVRLADSLAFYWQNRSVIRSPANGNIKLGDSAETAFGLLQFGGVTSSYPAIKRNGAAINFRLSDDSADASITAASITASTFLKSGSYTVATVPSAATSGAGARIYVSDEVGGATPAFSDATNWRRYADRAIIA